MRERKRLACITISMTIVGLSLLACSDGGASSSNSYAAHSAVITPTPTPDAQMNLYKTQAVANMQADYAEQTAVAAKQTSLAIDAQVTTQAIETREAREQWAFEATQTAVAARQAAAAAEATATAQARETRSAIAAIRATDSAQATATARSLSATATAFQAQIVGTERARLDALEGTAIAATAQAVERANRQAEQTQALRSFAPWALLGLVTVSLAVAGYRLLPVAIDRWRVIRRKAGEGEPIVILEQDANGNQKIALPLRSLWHMIDSGHMPETPPAQLQDRTTARQQLANVVQAARAPKRKPKRVVRPVQSALPARSQIKTLSPASTIQVVDPEKVQPWLEEVEGQLVEDVNVRGIRQ